MSSDSLAALLLVLCTVLVVRYLERQKSVWLQTLLQWVPPILFAYIVPAVGPLETIATGAKTVDGVRVRCERDGSRLIFVAEEEVR